MNVKVLWDDRRAGLEADGEKHDTELEELCLRRLDHCPFPRVYIDATYVKTHPGGRAVFEAVVAVTGSGGDGSAEVLGFDVGDSEDEGFWQRLLFTLAMRGLHGVVEVVTGEVHTGLGTALRTVFPNARLVLESGEDELVTL